MNEWKKIDKNKEIGFYGIFGRTVCGGKSENIEKSKKISYVALIEPQFDCPQFIYVNLEKYIKDKFTNPKIIYEDSIEKLRFIGEKHGLSINSPLYKSISCNDLYNGFITDSFIIARCENGKYSHLTERQTSLIREVFGIERFKDIERTGFWNEFK